MHGEPVIGRRLVPTCSTALFGLLLAAGCAHPGPPPSLLFEHHTHRIPLTVDAGGMAQLAEHHPLAGRIDLGPIFAAEGMVPVAEESTNLQMLVHYGRFYLAADGFRSVWEVSPAPGSPTASYRPIPVVDAAAPPMREVRLSRFGPAEAACVRIDRAGGETVFIDALGEIHAICR